MCEFVSRGNCSDRAADGQIGVAEVRRLLETARQLAPSLTREELSALMAFYGSVVERLIAEAEAKHEDV